MSSFKVKKVLVIEAANNALTRNDAIRQEHFEKKVLAAIRRCGLFRLFGVKPRSREDAEMFVKACASGHEKWQIQGWGTRRQAENLLSACAVTESELVELCTDEAAFVRKWVNERKDEAWHQNRQK